MDSLRMASKQEDISLLVEVRDMLLKIRQPE